MPIHSSVDGSQLRREDFQFDDGAGLITTRNYCDLGPELTAYIFQVCDHLLKSLKPL